LKKSSKNLEPLSTENYLSMNNKIQKIIDNKNQKLSKKQESGNFNQILSI
jgi:hypothetical protein